MGWHRTGARQGGQADDAAEVPSRNGCNVLGRDGTAAVQKGRCGYAPDISSNNNNVQKDDGGQTAFIIMEVNDTRRETSGRNMRGFIPWLERYWLRGVQDRFASRSRFAL